MEECVYFVYKFITSDDYLIAESQKHSKRPCKLQPIAMSAKTNGISKYTTEQHTAKVSKLSMACLISPFICIDFTEEDQFAKNNETVPTQDGIDRKEEGKTHLLELIKGR